MDEFVTAIGGLTRLLLICGGSISGVAVVFVGYNFMLGQGDPSKMAQAKMGLIGVVVGLIVMGMAFILPNVVSEAVLEPVGGVALTTDSGTSCDGILQNQLVFQRGASNGSRIMQVISQLQVQRGECAREVWNPVVIQDNGGSTNTAVNNTAANGASSERNFSKCFGASAIDDSSPPANAAKLATLRIGDNSVPSGLRLQNDLANWPRRASGRDGANNIIVYWSTDAEEKPSDGSSCWLYVSRLGVWSQSY